VDRKALDPLVVALRPRFTAVTCATNDLSWCIRIARAYMLSSASAGSGTRGLYTGSAALGSGDVRLTVVRVGPARIALVLAVVKDRHTVGDDPPMPSCS